MTHLLLMLLFGAFVSVVFGVIGRETGRERALYGIKVFAEFIGIGLVLAWLLFWLPR